MKQCLKQYILLYNSKFTAWNNTKNVWVWNGLSDVFGHTWSSNASHSWHWRIHCRTVYVVRCQKRLECSCRYFLLQWHHLFLIVLVIFHANACEFDYCFIFQRRAPVIQMLASHAVMQSFNSRLQWLYHRKEWKWVKTKQDIIWRMSSMCLQHLTT